MNIKWTMTEKEWKDYVHDHKTKSDDSKYLSTSADCYGNIIAGKICCDFIHSLDVDAWYPYVNTFCLDRDTGYGYTEEDRPYDLLDAEFSVPINCKTFDNFKKECEKRFMAMIKDNNLIAETEGDTQW